MNLLLVLISALALASGQKCSCEKSSHEFTDLRFNCPLDNFCSDALIAGSCGLTCHASGAFHSSPYDDEDTSVKIGNHTCAGAKFDFDFGGNVLCAYANPSSVLSTSTPCTVQIFECPDCDPTALRYFDYDDEDYQILCETGLIQHTYSMGIVREYEYRLHMHKKTCAISGGDDSSLRITSVSCKTRPYEIYPCLEQLGFPSGLTGRCRYGTCWLYCEDKKKQLSFGIDIDESYPRIKTDILTCESGFSQYGQGTAFNAECN